MDPVQPSVGWGVLHLFYRVDRDRAERDPEAAKRVIDAVQSLATDGHQALLFAVLGHKADLGVMALGPDLARLQAFQQELRGTPLALVDSYVSLTELSEYTVDRGRRACPTRHRGAARRARGSRRGSRRGASAWRTTRSSGIHPQLPREADDLLLPDVEAPGHGGELVLAARSRSASS